VTRSAALPSAAQVPCQLALAGVFLLAARAGAPAAFGHTVAALGVAVIVVDLVDFGGNQLLTREISSGDAPRNLYSSFLARKGAVLAVVVPLWVAISYSITGQATIAALGLYVGTLAVSQTGQAALRGTHRFGRLAILMLLERLAALAVAVLVFTLSGSPSVVLTVSLVTASAAGALVCTFTVARGEHWGDRYEAFSLRRWYRRSRGLGLSVVFSDLQALDVFLVAAAAGAGAAGYFAAANKLLAVLLLVPVNIGYVLLPTLSSLGEDAARRRLTRHAGTLCVAITAAVVIIPMTLSGSLTAFLFGQPYHAAGGALVVYCLAVLLVAVNQPLSVYLQVAGRDLRVGYAMAALSILNIPVVLLLSHRFGQTGGAGGFLLLQVLLISFLLSQWRKPVPVRRDLQRVRVPELTPEIGIGS
jgi:O-antigen/teichoic acid export membrane protein